VVAYRTLRGVLQQQRRGRRCLGLDAIVAWSAAFASVIFRGRRGIYRAPLLPRFLGFARSRRRAWGWRWSAPPLWSRSFTYAAAGQVDWLVGIRLAIGGTAAISAGVALAYRLPERRPAPRLLRPVGGDGDIAGAARGERPALIPAPQFEANGLSASTPSGRK